MTHWGLLRGNRMPKLGLIIDETQFKWWLEIPGRGQLELPNSRSLQCLHPRPSEESLGHLPGSSKVQGQAHDFGTPLCGQLGPHGGGCLTPALYVGIHWQQLSCSESLPVILLQIWPICQTGEAARIWLKFQLWLVPVYTALSQARISVCY